MHKLTRYLLILLFMELIYPGHLVKAQEMDHHKVHNYDYHKLTAMMGNAFIDNSFSNQTNDILIVPAFGLNYDYIFKCGWGLGLHSDILLQQFKAEVHGDDEEIIRENPVAL